MRLIQLIGDNIEELYNFDDGVTDSMIKEWYKRYQDQEYIDSFEEYLNNIEFIDADRVFVDEIYV